MIYHNINMTSYDESLSAQTTPRCIYQDSERPYANSMNIPNSIIQSKKYQNRVAVFKYEVHKISLSNLHEQTLQPYDIILLNDETAAFCRDRIYQYDYLRKYINVSYYNSKIFMIYPHEIIGIVQKQDVDYNTLFKMMS